MWKSIEIKIIWELDRLFQAVTILWVKENFLISILICGLHGQLEIVTSSVVICNRRVLRDKPSKNDYKCRMDTLFI